MKATFASHPKSKFWSARNEGNPEDYALNSHKVCWFDCDCGHPFKSSLLNINDGPPNTPLLIASFELDK